MICTHCNQEYTYFDDMKNPENATCGTCIHWDRCSKMFIGLDAGENTRCDFSPSRYRSQDGKLKASGIRYVEHVCPRPKLTKKKARAKQRYDNYLRSEINEDFGWFIRSGYYKEFERGGRYL